MAYQVFSQAQLTCSFGTTPSTLTVLPANNVGLTGKPAATIMDHQPMINIAPFGMCTTLSNPQVASATSAAMGTLTPQPCVPVTPQPWTTGAVKVNIRGQKALTNRCQLMCQWGGVITITDPGAQSVNST